MIESIQFGSKQIVFSVMYSNRKTLGLTVTPELKVIVNAPISATQFEIEKRVRKRAPWILKQLDYFNNFLPSPVPKQFRGGETHYYLGRQLKLNITIGKKEGVTYKGRSFEVVTKNKKRVEMLMQTWYKMKAKQVFAEIAEPLILRFKKYNVAPSSIYTMPMKKRWGSCSAKGRITLNTELIKAQKACIEYVIIHELCHLVHHNHSAKFAALLYKEMPDWERWKNKLEQYVT
jgi:predicted metal-dependent hydrolase